MFIKDVKYLCLPLIGNFSAITHFPLSLYCPLTTARGNSIVRNAFLIYIKVITAENSEIGRRHVDSSSIWT